MWPRLAAVELLGRNREAVALKHTELLGASDPQLIRTVGSWTDVVLVTNDDNMPAEHGELLVQAGLTVAVVAPRADKTFTRQEWERETVHRWAHRIAEQPPGTIVRYSPSGHALWRPRRRSPDLGGPARRRAPLSGRVIKASNASPLEEPLLPFER